MATTSGDVERSALAVVLCVEMIGQGRRSNGGPGVDLQGRVV
jgi:hypothetical protein